MLANTQDQVVNKQGNTTGFITYAATMTNIDYSRCDSLVPEGQTVKDIHYKINLSNTTVRGKHLVLCDGGANGLIIRRDIKIVCFNCDGKNVSIKIPGDHQLTGNRLCTGVTMVKSNVGRIKLVWCQGAQVKSQKFESVDPPNGRP